MPKTEQTLFFAWQSDSPAGSNRGAIRLALTAAATAIEAERPGLTLRIDEATRDMIGADNVPATILEKIEAADIFLGDVTTVTPRAAQGVKARSCPNPNVTFEAGYAAAHLGWRRMILLINLEIASFDDLPFDFDRQRVSQYRVKGETDTKGVNRLTELLVEAVKRVLDGDPPRPAELRLADPAEIRRRRDLDAVRRALSTIAVPKLEDHIARLPRIFDGRDLHHYYSYHGVVATGLFHINDPALDSAVRGLDEAWARALSFAENYNDAGVDRYVFSNPGDAPLSEDQEEDWNSILAARDDMHRHLETLLALIRENYVEIDLIETNRQANEQWRKEQKEDERLRAGND